MSRDTLDSSCVLLTDFSLLNVSPESFSVLTHTVRTWSGRWGDSFSNCAPQFIFDQNISFDPGIWGCEFSRQSLFRDVFVLFVRLGCFHEEPFPVGTRSEETQSRKKACPSHRSPQHMAPLTFLCSFPAEGPQLPSASRPSGPWMFWKRRSRWGWEVLDKGSHADWWRIISVGLDVTKEFEAVYLIKIFGSQG